ncbi:HdeD family acid-resistance protein [Pseudooceanicola sp. HF7]|uniref:HdeD family acid-resistance protein n=1 Tax=Pseudooceanicola sp. HF7 TaxID=2721560 RepID=UPI00158EF46C|nr:DUF308 domain-containing protein [Pseudooceanicola sp. HF7]
MAETTGVNWTWWVILGVIGIIGGIVALLNPFAATVTAQQMVAWIFLLLGVLKLITIFRAEGWRERLWAVVLTVLYLWLGGSLLYNPLEGIITLTFVAAIMFTASGISKIIYALTARNQQFRFMMLISGVISIVLAVMIFTNFPASAAVTLGILLSVELISTGASLVALGMLLKNAPHEA